MRELFEEHNGSARFFELMREGMREAGIELENAQARCRPPAASPNMVQGAGCRAQGAGCRVQGAGCRVQGAGCRVQSLSQAKVLVPLGARGGSFTGKTSCDCA